ncbi:hypothetical protein QBK99_05220 [Corticibacterium sp. UT-5YL-CI-8]|nr:hypothetical protein [Tianweitania sp. UT-5YL-CI-8]
MTIKLAITANQVAAICIGAKKAGYAPVIQVGDVFVRLIPEHEAIQAIAPQKKSTERDRGTGYF